MDELGWIRLHMRNYKLVTSGIPSTMKAAEAGVP